jgi:hypothetical protein
MSKNPILNALAATAYIFVLVIVMTFGSRLTPHPNVIVMPVAMISLFTLSAAVMGYLFCYQPIQLYFDGKKKQGVNLFLHTVIAFACVVVLTLVLLFTGVIK